MFLEEVNVGVPTRMSCRRHNDDLLRLAYVKVVRYWLIENIRYYGIVDEVDS